MFDIKYQALKQKTTKKSDILSNLLFRKQPVIIIFINTFSKILYFIKNFLAEVVSGSAFLLLFLILAVNLGFRLRRQNKLTASAKGIIGGLEKQQTETAWLNLSEEMTIGQNLNEDTVNFVFRENGTAVLDPINPSNVILSNREGIMLYKVQAGDSLPKIADKFGISTNSIIWANPGLRASSIKPGQEIVILPVEGVLHEIREGETLNSIAALYGVSTEEIKKNNPDFQEIIQSPHNRLIIPHGRPLYGYANRWATDLVDLGNYYKLPANGWNLKELHNYNAVDIVGNCGSPIYAAAEGLIIQKKTDDWNDGYGNYLKIEHPNGTYTVYAHLDKISVAEGEYVTQGQQLSTMGNTGNASDCHLHFEVYGAKNSFAKY